MRGRHRREVGARGIALGALIALLLGSAIGLMFARLDSASATEGSPAAFVVPTPSVTFETPAPSTTPTPPLAKPAARAPRGFVDYSKTCGNPSARAFHYRVSIDTGLGVDRTAVLKGLRSVLCDARGWIASGRVRFVYDPKGPYLISLRTADGTERRCLALTGLSVHRTYSCAGAREAVLNGDRWLKGSATWAGSVSAYRTLMVNHEVGHLLGQSHRGCSGVGRAAPVMMQQSKGLDSCRPNSWPLAYELRSIRF